MGFKKRNRQISVFEYPSGFHGASIDPSNRWVQLSHQMPWDLIEDIYSTKFLRTSWQPGISIKTGLWGSLSQAGYECLRRRFN